MRVVVRSESQEKHLYRRDVLQGIADRIFEGEALRGDLEVSVLFCDDACIRDLNKRYRKKPRPTDVLSFGQAESAPGPVSILGDVVISLETARRNSGCNRVLARKEVKLLFCHGLLHLLGYTHGAAKDRDTMIAKQARYLAVTPDDAWHWHTSLKTG